MIEEAIDTRLELILAQPAMVELERILTAKLGFEPERWREVKELLLELSTDLIAPPEDPPKPVSGDPDHDLILACAIQARVDALVSGDRRHLLPLGVHRGVRIVTPQALLAELRRT